MATMYSLFFGILLIAVCNIVPPEHHLVETQGTVFPLNARADLPIRARIIHIAQNEIGVREATGNNDGTRVAEYLRYTDLDKGYAWCAAFVSWCYGQAGLPEPRNPWSPALFPNAQTYCRVDACRRPNTINKINSADIFGIYSQHARRINHVGLIKAVQGGYIMTIEGNSNNRVETRRRPVSTLYALANWVSETGNNKRPQNN